MGVEKEQLEVIVASRTDEADDIIAVELLSVSGDDLPPFTAGSHIDLHLAENLIRQYSICNDPSQRHRYLLGILRDPASRGGSEEAHASLWPGHVLTISRPRNNFALVEDAARTVLIAGGIGVTPMLAMAHRLAALGQPFQFHYLCRSSSRVAFRDVLKQPHMVDACRLHLDDGEPSQRFDFQSDVGYALPGGHLYVCGPRGLIQSLSKSAEASGWPADSVHIESFSPALVSEATDQPFMVTAARSGVTVEVLPGKSIAQALIEAGVDVALSCEQGICRTCLTEVLEGTPLHRDDCMTDEERKAGTQIAICCSRALSEKLILDL